MICFRIFRSIELSGMQGRIGNIGRIKIWLVLMVKIFEKIVFMSHDLNMERINRRKCTKDKLINFFKCEIKSELGKVAENFLCEFPFPNNEKHSLSNLIQTIEDGEYPDISNIIDAYEQETKYITSILGSQSDQALFISGYFSYLKDKYIEEISSSNSNEYSIILEKIQNFQSFLDKMPNNRDEFIRMYNTRFFCNEMEFDDLNLSNNHQNQNSSQKQTTQQQNTIITQNIDEYAIDSEKLSKNLNNT